MDLGSSPAMPENLRRKSVESQPLESMRSVRDRGAQVSPRKMVWNIRGLKHLAERLHNALCRFFGWDTGPYQGT